MEYVTLNNGVKMPLISYGVYQVKPEDTYDLVGNAIEVIEAMNVLRDNNVESIICDAMKACTKRAEELGK